MLRFLALECFLFIYQVIKLLGKLSVAFGALSSISSKLNDLTDTLSYPLVAVTVHFYVTLYWFNTFSNYVFLFISPPLPLYKCWIILAFELIWISHFVHFHFHGNIQSGRNLQSLDFRNNLNMVINNVFLTYFHI